MIIDKKTLFHIFLIILLASGIACCVKMWTGRNVLDYIWKKYKGYYETVLYVCQQTDGEGGFYTAYSNGKYIYYDSESRKIYDYETQKCIIECNGEIKDLCVNDDSIFFIAGSEVYQYKLDGSKVAKVALPGEECLNFAYAGDENIYCDGQAGALYIFPAGNISEKTQPVSLESGDKRTIEADGYKEDIFLINTHEAILGFRTENLEDFKATNEQGYVRICNTSGTDSEIYVMNAKIGEKLGYQEKRCMGMFEKELYFLDDKIYRLTDRNQCLEVGKSPLYTGSGFPYSKCMRDGKKLVVLGEKYRWNLSPDGVASSGTVGDYMGSQICFVNLETKEAERQYEIDNGQVIWMEGEQYAVFEDGEVRFYRAEDGKLMKTDRVKGYKAGREYEIDACHGKLFFFCNERLLDVVDIA